MKLALRASLLILTITLCTSLFARKRDGMPKGIDWYLGQVKDAFILAKKENKPLFLYWGAIWCPPCNQMKKNIFSKSIFKTSIKSFIAVYLDGDDPRAQIWGEKLKASGYPTMMIMSPAGKELTRLPTGTTAEKYISLMNSTLQKMKPVKSILQDALKGQISKDEWATLAGYSWGQDESTGLKGKKKVETFSKLYQKIPKTHKEERSNIFLLYLTTQIEEYKKKNHKYFKKFIPEIQNILNSPALIESNLETLSYTADTIVGKLTTKNSNQRKMLQSKWLRVMTKIEKDNTKSIDERVSAVAPLVFLHILNKGKKAKFPKSIKERVKTRVLWASKIANDHYSRQAVMGTGIWLIRKTGQIKLAKELGIKELKKTKSPHYFMSGLAITAKANGNKKEALEWMKKAWHASKGRATRFQWGTSYISGIMDLAPKKTKLLQETIFSVVDENLKTPDSFSGRNKKRFAKLKKSLGKWNKKNKQKSIISAIKKKLKTRCDVTMMKKECLAWASSL